MKNNQKPWTQAIAILAVVIGAGLGLKVVYPNDLNSLLQNVHKAANVLTLRISVFFGHVPDPIVELAGETKIKSVRTVRVDRNVRYEGLAEVSLNDWGCTTVTKNVGLINELREILVAEKVSKGDGSFPAFFRPVFPRLGIYLEMETGSTTSFLFQWPYEIDTVPVQAWLNGDHVTVELSMPDRVALWMDKARDLSGQFCPGLDVYGRPRIQK